jgi:hypothetical protein
MTVDVAMPRSRAIDCTMQAFIADIATVLSFTDPTPRVTVMAYQQAIENTKRTGIRATFNARQKLLTSHAQAIRVPVSQWVERMVRHAEASR